MKTNKILVSFAIALSLLAGCKSGSKSVTETETTTTTTVTEVTVKEVTPENYIRAEVDRTFYEVSQLAGINKFHHNRTLTPLDSQVVVRMNRDVLYSFAVVDVSKGATVTFPEIPKGRYASVEVIDNDHYCPMVIYAPGKHDIPKDTKYMALAIRIQVFNPKDAAEIALINSLQDRFIIESNSADPFPKPNWDIQTLDSLHRVYNAEFSKYTTLPVDWMGPKGTLNEQTRHIAVAGAFGLLPAKDATYINYDGGNLTADKCYTATYTVPPVGAFWSITVYGKDGFIKSENCIINESNVHLNKGETFTVYYGPADKCPKTAQNRLDITDGWNIIMRCYKPGQPVLDGTYKLPPVTEVK